MVLGVAFPGLEFFIKGPCNAGIASWAPTCKAFEFSV